MKIYLPRKSETLCYAAEELARCLKQMDATLSPTVTDTPAKDAITLGLLSELGLPTDDVGDPVIDDVIDINVKSLCGYIAGSNERSVLMGVYTLLKAAGCRWVRPGDEGEFLPRRPMREHSLRYRKKADFPFRGECIEGAVSFEHVRDTILWLPKVNMNLFMMEQIVPYNYMSRWYRHEGSTVKSDENVSFEQIGEMIPRLEEVIKKCGLQLHALGHGYQMEPYGIHYKTRNDLYELSEEARRDVALVAGERKLFKNSPNFTQMCYSRPEVRKKQVDFLVSYLERKPHIDFLHVWLADSVNNHCECDGCRKMTPSDFYVILLNELDAALTAKGIDTRIVFIAYTDTHWAPEVSRFQNPDRFVLTTASSSYPAKRSAERSRDPLPVYVRNQYRSMKDFAQALSMMDRWREQFRGPNFMFDYYFYTSHFLDPGYMHLTRAIHYDVQLLDALGFDGIMSDQTQRSFFPTGLPLAFLGEKLFDKSLDVEAFAADFLHDAFGADTDRAQAYLEAISATFDPESFRLKDSIVLQDTGTGETVKALPGIKNNPEARRRFDSVEAIAKDFLSLAQKNATAADPCHARSWRLLEIHTEYVTRLSHVLSLYADGKSDAALAALDEMLDWLWQIEDEIHPQFDTVLFRQRISQLLKM